MLCFVAQNFAKVTALIGKDPTMSRRTELWKMSLADIQENPLLGYGYGAFWDTTSRPARLIREEVWKEAPHSHNGYIELALGLGLVGLGAYSLVFVTMAQRSYSVLHEWSTKRRKVASDLPRFCIHLSAYGEWRCFRGHHSLDTILLPGVLASPGQPRLGWRCAPWLAESLPQPVL